MRILFPSCPHQAFPHFLIRSLMLWRQFSKDILLKA